MAEVRYRITAKDQTKKATQSAQKNVGGLKKSAAGLGKSFASALVPIASVTAGLAALTKTISDSVKAYSKQEEAVTRLTSALQASGAEVESVSAELQAHASALQEVTTFGDEAIIQQQSFLASLGYTKNEIKELTTAAVNLASSGMVTLDSAVKNLVRTKSGLSGELGEIIPQIRNLTKEELEAGEAIDVVQKQFDGMAESLADTGVGALKQYRNAMGDLKEQMGQTLVNAIRPFVEGLTNIVTNLTEAIKKQRTYNEVVEGTELSGDAGEKTVSQLEDALDKAQEKLEGYRRSSGMAADALVKKQAKIVAALEEEIAAKKNLEAVQNNIQVQADAAAREEERKARERAEAAERRRKNLEKWHKYYDQTKMAQIESLQQTINWFASLEIQGEKTKAILEMLRDRMSDLKGESEEAAKELATYWTKLFRLSGEAAMVFKQGRPRRDRGDTGRRQKVPPASSPTNVPDYSGAGSGVWGEISGTDIGKMITQGPLQALASAAMKAMMSIEGFSKIMNFATTMFQSMAKFLEPLVNAVLGPLVEFLTVIGQMLGKLFAPLFEDLAPIFFFIAKILQSIFVPVLKMMAPLVEFITLQFQVLQPILQGVAIAVAAIMVPFNILGDAVTFLVETLRTAVHNVIEFVSHPFKKKKRDIWDFPTFSLEESARNAAKQFNKTVDQVLNTQPGGVGKDFSFTDTGGDFQMGDYGGGGGTAAQYTGATTINATINIQSDVIAGEGGLRQLVVMLRDEMLRLEELGA